MNILMLIQHFGGMVNLKRGTKAAVSWATQCELRGPPYTMYNEWTKGFEYLLLQKRTSETSERTNPVTKSGEFEIQRLRHYYGMAGWYWFTGADSYLEVSTWVKYVDGAPFNADVNLRYQLPSAPYIGFGMSTAGNFHFEAGINVGQSYNADTNFRVGYGFD